MQRNFWLTIFGVGLTAIAFGQVKKQFTVEDAQSCQNIKLCLKAN